MPEQQHSHAKLLWSLALLVLALVIVSSLAAVRLTREAAPKASLSESIRLGQASRPAFTPEIQQKLATSKGFQALVSYTDRGFEPTSVRMAAGQTVRFTNNSSALLSLTVGEVRTTLDPQDFFEHAFVVPGEFRYSDGVKGSVIVVE